MFYANDPQEAIEKSGESSRTTHGATVCIDACRYFGALIVGALNGEDKETILSDHYCPVTGYWQEKPLCKEIADIASGSFKHKNPPEIRGTGYVVQSLEAALWAFYHSDTFKDGCLMAVNLGDDADTTGAIYGQIAGAYYGEEGIPRKMAVDVLASRGYVAALTDQLISHNPLNSHGNRYMKTCNKLRPPNR